MARQTIHKRRLSISVDVFLTRKSKQAYESTVSVIAEEVAEYAAQRMEEAGYTIDTAQASLELGTVRHKLSWPLRRKKIRKMRAA